MFVVLVYRDGSKYEDFRGADVTLTIPPSILECIPNGMIEGVDNLGEKIFRRDSLCRSFYSHSLSSVSHSSLSLHNFFERSKCGFFAFFFLPFLLSL